MGLDEDVDDAVRRLIIEFAQAVRALNAGASLPARQRIALERELGIRKRGRPRSVLVASRNAEIAQRISDHYAAIAAGATDVPITHFLRGLIDELAARGRVFTLSELFRLHARHRDAAAHGWQAQKDEPIGEKIEVNIAARQPTTAGAS